MRKFQPFLPSTVAGIALVASLMPAGAIAAPTTDVDVTVAQTCQYGREYQPGAVTTTLHIPARVQLTVPQTLHRGDVLPIAARKVTLSLDGAAHTAFEQGIRASSGYRVGLYLSPLGIEATGVKRQAAATYNGTSPSWQLGERPATAAFTFSDHVPYDVTGEEVRLAYTGFSVSVGFQVYDTVTQFRLTCTPDAPTTLATLPVAPDLGTPSVQALSDVQSPIGGGAELRVQGRNFSGADSVSVGGVPATAFTVVSDDVIKLTVPPHAAAEAVQVRVARGAAASEDTALDDFDYVAAVTPGRFDVSIPQQCVEPSSGLYTSDGYVELTPERRWNATLRLRGAVPASVAPGAAVPVTNVRASVLFDGATTRELARDSFPTEKRYWRTQLFALKAAAQGASAAEAPLGAAMPPALEPQLLPGEPVAIRAGDLNVLSTPVPVTATAGAGSSVVLSAPSFSYTLFPSYGGGTGMATVSAGCTAADPAALVAKVPVAAPVADGPVVTKVQGVVVAGVGGVVAVTGQRITGASSVKIGGKSASRIGVIGNTVYVNAPALAAGTYDVTVTTSKGTSPVTAATKLRYPKLF